MSFDPIAAAVGLAALIFAYLGWRQAVENGKPSLFVEVIPAIPTRLRINFVGNAILPWRIVQVDLLSDGQITPTGGDQAAARTVKGDWSARTGLELKYIGPASGKAKLRVKVQKDYGQRTTVILRGTL